MPVAFVYGWDPAMLGVAGSPYRGHEYDLIGAIRQEPVELVKCETSDIEVPASAEIVVEGTISPDPSTYEMEGPFGEGGGFYGEARKRPVVDWGMRRDSSTMVEVLAAPAAAATRRFSARLVPKSRTASCWSVRVNLVMGLFPLRTGGI